MGIVRRSKFNTMSGGVSSTPCLAKGQTGSAARPESWEMISRYFTSVRMPEGMEWVSS